MIVHVPDFAASVGSVAKVGRRPGEHVVKVVTSVLQPRDHAASWRGRLSAEVAETRVPRRCARGEAPPLRRREEPANEMRKRHLDGHGWPSK